MNNLVTHFMLRIVERKYAKDFIEKGSLKFGIPLNWITYSTAGRGDPLEGTYSGRDMLLKDDLSNFISRKSSQEKLISGRIYKYSLQILHIPCVCFYGINNTHFHYSYNARLERNEWTGKVDLKYFEELRDNMSKEKIESMKYEEQPVVIFIKSAHELKLRIIKALRKYGFSEKDVICGPVSYIDKGKNFNLYVKFPFELMYKDSKYSKQSEIRFIINSYNKYLIKKLEKNNYVIDIGYMGDIAQIYDMYYYDMDMIITNGGFSFKLPKSTEVPYDQLSKEEIISIMYAAYKDKLPEGSLTMQERTKICNTLNDILKKKYRTFFDCEHKHIFKI